MEVVNILTIVLRKKYQHAKSAAATIKRGLLVVTERDS